MSSSYFDIMPIEILNVIFSFLTFQDRSSCSRTCKSWLKFLLESPLSSDIIFDLDQLTQMSISKKETFNQQPEVRFAKADKCSSNLSTLSHISTLSYFRTIKFQKSEYPVGERHKCTGCCEHWFDVLFYQLAAKRDSPAIVFSEIDIDFYGLLEFIRYRSLATAIRLYRCRLILRDSTEIRIVFVDVSLICKPANSKTAHTSGSNFPFEALAESKSFLHRTSDITPITLTLDILCELPKKFVVTLEKIYPNPRKAAKHNCLVAWLTILKRNGVSAA